MIALLVLAGAYLAGFITSDQHFFPSDHLLSAKEMLRDLLKRGNASAPVAEINTALLRLAVTTVKVKGGEVEWRGGGVTPTPAGLVGITGAGEFFLVKDGKARSLEIHPPSRHLAEYQVAARGEFAHLQHNFTHVRYNAPLYVEPEGQPPLLLLTYTEWLPEGKCYDTALARLDLPAGGDLAGVEAGEQDWKVIFRTRPCLKLITTHEALQGHQSGGAMAFDPEAQRLLLTTGDFRVDGVYAEEIVAQDDATDYSKLLSMRLDGSDVRHEATGLRNPQGLLRLPDGVIWATEHGPRGGDELNRIVPGGNYGWPLRTLGTRYSSLPWPLSPTNGRHDTDGDFIGPVYAWVPSVGVAGITRVQGFDPAWDGDFLVSSMRGQTLFRLRMSEGHVQYAEPIAMQDRIRQVQQLADGVIVLWTDSHKVMFLRAAEASRTLLRANEEILRISGGDAAREHRLEAALQACLECHSLDPDAAASAPHLSGLMGRAVAGTSYAAYSQALRNAGGRWSRDRLATFLADPQAFAPGTPMPSPQLAPDAIADLVALLERLNSPE